MTDGGVDLTGVPVLIWYNVIECYPDEAPEPFGCHLSPTEVKAGDAIMLQWLDGNPAYLVSVLRVEGSTLFVTAPGNVIRNVAALVAETPLWEVLDEEDPCGLDTIGVDVSPRKVWAPDPAQWWRDGLVRYERGDWMFPPCPDVWCYESCQGDYELAYPSIWKGLGASESRCPHAIRKLPPIPPVVSCLWCGEGELCLRTDGKHREDCPALRALPCP